MTRCSKALQDKLETNLKQSLPTGGLTMFIQGWRQKATPLGRRYCQLAVSARPIVETDCGLWPTPVANDDNKTPEAHMAMKARMKGGARSTITSLQVMAKAVALWPTPQARDHFPAHLPEYVAAKKAQGHGMANLNDLAVALWPTPRATDGDKAVRTREGAAREFARGKSPDLPCQAAPLWTTPSSRDWKDTPGMVAERKDGKSRNDQLPRQVFGAMANGSSAPTKSIGSLNPAFPCWLMGFSTDALSSMHLAMQSFRKSRQSSSKR